MSKTLCIYHANCADGLGAAWAVHRALGDDVEFVAARHGEPAPTSTSSRVQGGIAGRDVLIVDFSYPLATLRAMAASADSVLVLDHHKTAQEDLHDLDAPMTYSEWVKYGKVAGNEPENLAAIFDLNRSGAGIAWDYLHPGDERAAEPSIRYGRRPRIIDLIEDRDLWYFRYGDETRAFHAVLMSYDITDLLGMFHRLDAWAQWSSLERGQKYQSRKEAEQEWQDILREGRAIFRAHNRAVASVVTASRRTIKIAGHTVPCANAPPSMASDAGHLLCELQSSKLRYEDDLRPDGKWGPLFSATYYDGADGKRHFSLRSPEGGADVGAIAKQMAKLFNDSGITVNGIANWTGGGHVCAAGFNAPLGWEGE